MKAFAAGSILAEGVCTLFGHGFGVGLILAGMALSVDILLAENSRPHRSSVLPRDEQIPEGRKALEDSQ